MRVLVVLGAAVRPDGQPGPALARRVARAAEIWAAGGADRIVVTGGAHGDVPSEASVMAGLLRVCGVPEGAIDLEDRARDTLENARFSLPILTALAPAEIRVVTDGFHGPRARLCFAACGLGVRIVSASDTPPRAGLRARITGWLREGIALPVYALRLAGPRLRRAAPPQR